MLVVMTGSIICSSSVILGLVEVLLRAHFISLVFNDFLASVKISKGETGLREGYSDWLFNEGSLS
jgi:hypothetical protein